MSIIVASETNRASRINVAQSAPPSAAITERFIAIVVCAIKIR
jgi:hypothetical protein